MATPGMELYGAYIHATRAAESALIAHYSKTWQRGDTATTYHIEEAQKALVEAAAELGRALMQLPQQEAAQ